MSLNKKISGHDPFWSMVVKQKAIGDLSSPMNLSELAKTLLVLPHSNADQSFSFFLVTMYLQLNLSCIQISPKYQGPYPGKLS
jgi:uncharacterized membrane protein